MYTEEGKFRQTEATVIKSTKKGNGVLKKEKGVLRPRMSKEDFRNN